MPRTFFHTAFIFLMNNAIFVIHSIIHSIVQQNYSFKEFIHSKKHANYSFKEFIHSKKIQNYSFKENIHSSEKWIIAQGYPGRIGYENTEVCVRARDRLLSAASLTVAHVYFIFAHTLHPYSLPDPPASHDTSVGIGPWSLCL